jgi:hypothetical protein
MDGNMDRMPLKTPSKLTTPRAAAIAGIAFSVLLISSLVLIRISVPADPKDAGDWLSRDWRTVSLGLNLIPFAGIAFLWFIGVIRDRLGEHEDRFFSTVFLGSGLMFLAMLFTSGALAGGIISVFGATPGMLINSGSYSFGRTVAYELMNVYTMKMAGVFMTSACTLALRTGIFPRWLAFLGMVLALFLMLALGYFVWAPLVFPSWILLISLYILRANYSQAEVKPAAAQ